MEPRSLSPWFWKIFLLGVYLIWVGAMLQAGSMEPRWAGVAAGTLLVLIWLPWDVYHKRHEWLVWLPMHVTVVIATVLILTLMADNKGMGKDTALWYRPLHAALGGIFWTTHFFAERIKARRDAGRTEAFLAERRAAPKKKPVPRFAGPLGTAG
jgi:hypothetical protein